MIKRLKTFKYLSFLIGLLVLLILLNLIVPNTYSHFYYLSKFSLTTCIVLIFFIYKSIKKSYLLPLRQATDITSHLSKGNVNIDLAAAERLGELGEQLKKLATDMLEVSSFVHSIGEGRFETELVSLSKQEGLGRALIEMKNKLSDVFDEEQKRNWKTLGIAQMGDILRKSQNLNTHEISLKFLQTIIPYVSLNQGGVFIVNKDSDGRKIIELIACFAYNKKKYAEKKIEWGKGLIGECILEGAPIHLTDIPQNYLRITSGLGDSNPRSIFLVPIKHNEESLGVLEVASFKNLQDYEKQFLVNVCDSLGAVIFNARSNEQTQNLLEKAENIADELRLKEENLRMNEEELLATQEELNRKLKQIEQETSLIQSIVDAVNKTNASIELDLDGKIINVNEMYLSLMEYSREELIGKNEKDLIASTEVEAQRYDMMWESIRKGAFNSGEFKRISKGGRDLWLSGTYSPILDVEGKPTKIIQLAQFTTEQKERELEFNSKIQALNQSVFSLELSCEGILLSSNALFQKELGYKRSELINKPFLALLDPSAKSAKEQIGINSVVGDENFIVKVLKFITKEGEEKFFICNFSPIKNLAGAVNKIMVIMIDYSEQFRLQQEMKHLLIEEKRKNSVLELKSATSADFATHFAEMLLQLEENYDYAELDFILRKTNNIPVIILDQYANITFANSSALAILGTEESKLYEYTVFDLFYFSEDEEKVYFEKRVSNLNVAQMKVHIKDKNGNLLKLNIFVAPNSKEFDKFSSIMIFILNVELPPVGS